jgi:cytoskeleton protein RodZ
MARKGRRVLARQRWPRSQGRRCEDRSEHAASRGSRRSVAPSGDRSRERSSLATRVFQIGPHLADRRRHLGLTLADCESATKIRVKYLRAIEEDRLDDLPERAYVRSFLRTYATFLEADVGSVLAEYDERHGGDELQTQHRLVPPEPPAGSRRAALGRWLVRPRRRSPRRELAWIAIGLGGVVVLVLWLGTLHESPSPPEPAAPGGASSSAASAPGASNTPARSPRRAPAGAGLRLTLTGGGTGGSYVRVHRGGPTGSVVYEGTVPAGGTVRLRGSGRLWIRVGWAPSLRVRVNGRPMPLSGGTENFLVTPTSVSRAD